MTENNEDLLKLHASFIDLFDGKQFECVPGSGGMWNLIVDNETGKISGLRFGKKNFNFLSIDPREGNPILYCIADNPKRNGHYFRVGVPRYGTVFPKINIRIRENIEPCEDIMQYMKEGGIFEALYISVVAPC